MSGRKLEMTKGGVVALTALTWPAPNPINPEIWTVASSYHSDSGDIVAYAAQRNGTREVSGTNNNTSAVSAGDGTWSVGSASWTSTKHFVGVIGFAIVLFEYLDLPKLRELVRDPFQVILRPEPILAKVAAAAAAGYPAGYHDTQIVMNNPGAM